jgi:hypothetical protein
MDVLKLFAVLLGGRQSDDLIEAHNFFVGVGTGIESLLPQIKRHWSGVTHIDAFMALENADGHQVVVARSENAVNTETYPRLMIYNIGYYKPGEFSEFHKLIPVVLRSENDPFIERLKRDPEFAQGRSEEAKSHVDDKFNISGTAFDVDDAIDVQKRIPGYSIRLVQSPQAEGKNNVLKLGYLFVKELKEIS